MLHLIIFIAVIFILGLLVTFFANFILLTFIEIFAYFWALRKILFTILIPVVIGYFIFQHFFIKLPFTSNNLITENSPPLDYYSNSYSFRGIFKSGFFVECCSDGDGVEKNKRYYFLQLPYQIKIKTINPESSDSINLQNINQIQIEVSKGNSFPDGTFVTVNCKELLEGNNGHFALQVYCADSVITAND